MKASKWIALLMALAMLLALTACGDTSTDTTTDTQQSTGDADNTDTTSDTTDPVDGDGTVYRIGICEYMPHPALDQATAGFQAALVENLGEDRVEFYKQNAAGDIPTCSTICSQFVSDDVDLILANATASLQAAASATNEIPILGTSVTDYATALGIDDWTGVTGTNISGTSDLAPLDQQADMLHELFPEAKTVGLLYCSGEPNSAYQANVIREYLEAYGYTVEDYTFADSNDVAAVTGNACNDCDVLYIPTDNTAATCTEAIQNVALPAGVPIIAGEEGICSGCGVATLSISYYDIGYEAGLMAIDILENGADISTMEIRTASEVTPKYNVSNCEAFSLTVPDDYVAIETEE
jgi:putative ABC transport system substrate-binding protein